MLSRSFRAGTMSPLTALHGEAHSIFSRYALSPADYSEATRRYVELRAHRDSLSDTARFDDLVYQVLYSMDCENVWLKEAREATELTA